MGQEMGEANEMSWGRVIADHLGQMQRNDETTEQRDRGRDPVGQTKRVRQRAGKKQAT